MSPARMMAGKAIALGAFVQSRAKTIDIWAAEGDFDPAKLQSNTFAMEWPPRSGRMQEFPEVDRADWFTPEAAEEKLLAGQRPVLKALLQHLGVPRRGGGEPERATRRSQASRTRAAAARKATSSGPAGASATYNLLRRAILEERPVTCTYQGRHREMCPLIIGHTDGQEKALVFQFGGDTSKGKVRAGQEQWKCLFVAQVRDARLRDGEWHEGKSHKTVQVCVRDVDLDINIHVR